MLEQYSPENQEKIKKPLLLFAQPGKIFIIEAFLFSLTLGLGIASTLKLNEFFRIEKISLPAISFWRFLFYFLLSTLFILSLALLGKFKAGKRVIYKGLFILAIGFGGIIFLNLWLPDILALSLILILIFWWLLKPSVLIHDLCLIFGMVGLGSILGLRLDPLMVVALLILFSIYDFIAVYKTKHMIKMAKEMIEAKAILGLIVPPRISDFRKNLEKVSLGGKFLILGGGDVVFPLLLVVSLIPFDIFGSLLVALFALIGLFVGFYIFLKQKVRAPIPALPPIALFSIIGYLITKLIQ